MTDEELAKEYAHKHVYYEVAKREDGTDYAKEVSDVTIEQSFLAGLKEGRPKWHKVFVDSEPYCYEYWDLPQDNLPKIENFYFVKLKNGFIKVCELKYDPWSRKKFFYDLHGGKQSNVAEWLDYPENKKV